MRGTVLPNDYFLVRDKEGRYHWYSKDPLRAKDRNEIEVSIEAVITEVVGMGDIANPVVVHLNCAKVDRSMPFNVGLLAAVRKGTEEKHFEDMNGNVVDILMYQNDDFNFPLTGAVLNGKGEGVGFRKYSFKGECSDGDEDHRLVVVNGEVRFEQPAGAQEGQEAE